MELETIAITGSVGFKMYLITSPLAKRIAKEFHFYQVRFYRQEMVKGEVDVRFDFPKDNVFWFLDFKKFLEQELYSPTGEYKNDWLLLLQQIKSIISMNTSLLKSRLENILPEQVLEAMFKYSLRQYQAYDFLQLQIKMTYGSHPAGLILSEQRTGKTRIALATCIERMNIGSITLVICPKSALVGWVDEIGKLNAYYDKTMPIFNLMRISTLLDLKDVKANYVLDKYNIVVMTYDIFKRCNESQINRFLCRKELMLIGDEVHRLRNFGSLQSSALFDFKDTCVKQKIKLTTLGITGTAGIRTTEDVFGLFCLINYSKIEFHPYVFHFNEFKEYFYNCEYTSFGIKTFGFKREEEINFLERQHSVQTKQRDLDLFKNYKVQYVKIVLPMDSQQSIIYNSIVKTLEYEEVDCKNPLAQQTRLQQVCVDPGSIVSSYTGYAPKIKYTARLIRDGNPTTQYIVMSKKLHPLDTLASVLGKIGIPYDKITGDNTFTERQESLKHFQDHYSRVLLMQLDVGRESFTISSANVTVFFDRDFAQGYNEQAEARMTPLDGVPITKTVVDLVMKDTVEEQYYETLVVKKQSIDSVNTLWRPKKDAEKSLRKEE